MKTRPICCLVAAAFLLQGDPADTPANISGTNCTFRASPDTFLSSQIRARREVFERAQSFQTTMRARSAAQQTAATPIPRRSLIDDEIFNRLATAKVAPAALSTDEEFLRRVTLDLTGRIPSSDDVRGFVASTDPGKRDAVIEQLLRSPEFNDKWTLWLGDLLQNTATQVTANVQRQISGRNAFYSYINTSVAHNKSLHDIAYEVIVAGGNNYDADRGSTNFIIGGSVTGGPAQDTYDGMLVRTASAFLGLSHYDCLLCHNGRGHLDQISVWGSQTTRMQAESMAAFFTRTRLTRYPAPAPPPGQTSPDPYYQSTLVEDVFNVNGYDLNTNFGNRPNRVAIGATRTLTPAYRETGAKPADGAWRAAFAQFLVDDPMFARNMANRLWKQMFNLGLVDPVDTLDPARLDPANPPPDPWTFQATHPVLLEKLAQLLRDDNFDLRGFLRLIAQSSAYQLSSRYDGDFQLEYVPLFARHYPRRLDAEEIHDAIEKATGVFTKYTIQGWTDPVQWAMQFPETVEPRSNGAVANFLNSFLRGNRDTTRRSQASSILQQLNLMNDNFVLSRTRVAASPVLTAIAKISDNNAALDELFLTFLSRKPSDYERQHSLPVLQKATTTTARNTAIEDLSWICINKLDFLLSY